MLKLFYITNNPQIAQIAQSAGVDRIFVDLEYMGKEQRQPNMDTVKNKHTVDDVKALRRVLDKAELLVRVNPINPQSKNEIDAVIDAGADIIMLPMWTNVDQVKQFVSIVNGRAKTILLLETDAASKIVDDVLSLNLIDEIHIGLNDLHLSQGKTFLFELLTDGTVDSIIESIKKYNIPYGIGGFGRVFSNDMLPAENIIAEHYRLGSSMSILSRAFCNTSKVTDLSKIQNIFTQGVAENRQYEQFLQQKLNCNDNEFFITNHKNTAKIISEIVDRIKNK